jgi:ABC-type polysaccharide/polyol phosphate export permease
MAHSTLKGQHFDSFFGQFWLVLNPLLLACVYFLLSVVLVGGGGLRHFVGVLTGVFVFFYTRNVIQLSAASITTGGKMITNLSFPKLLLPLAATITAMRMYFPTLLVYAGFYATVERRVTWSLLWLIPIFVLQTVFSFGLGLLCAAVAMYFRDLTALLPHLLRMWMYVSPVLFGLSYVRAKVSAGKLPHWMLSVYQWDPLSPIVNAWNTILVGDGVRPFTAGASHTPPVAELVAAAAVAVVSLLVGGWFFLSREREFAVRL